MLSMVTGKKVLVITGNVYPEDQGDSIFSNLLVRTLCETNQVAVMLDAKQASEAKLNVWNIYRFYEFSGRWRALFRFFNNGAITQIAPYSIEVPSTEHFDVVIIDHLRCFSLFKKIKKSLNYENLMYMAHNVEAINQVQAKKFGNYKARFSASYLNWTVSCNERRCIETCKYTFALSKQDAYYLQNLYCQPGINFVSIPLPQNHMVQRIAQKRIILIGSLAWYPNANGVNDFLTRCANVLEGFKIDIIGQTAGFPVSDFSDRENITFHGYIEDPSELIRGALCMVVPNTMGTGIKIKIYEGAAQGLPVVAVREAAAGYEHYPNTILHICDEIDSIPIQLEKLWKQNQVSRGL